MATFNGNQNVELLMGYHPAKFQVLSFKDK